MIFEEQQYEVFISYYWDTGTPLVDHLKKGLKKVGINAFVDRHDIPDTIKKESDEWHSYIDKAILECKLFVLIMTFGFNTSDEIKRELKLAMDNNIEKLYCKHNELPNTQKIITISEKDYDLSKYQYKPFSDEHDLLRKVGAVLFGSISEDRKEFFDENASKLINSGGTHLKYESVPTLEIILGPKYDLGNWLEVNKENKSLVRRAPDFKSLKTSREYYYGDTYTKEDYFRVYVNGFFHYIVNITDFEKGHYYVDNLLRRIIETTIFYVRLLKYKKMDEEHIMYFNLLHMNGHPFSFWERPFRDSYFFPPEKSEDIFRFNFNSSSKYSEFKSLFNKICREICIDLGITDITDLTINRKLWSIIRGLDTIYTEYSPQGLEAINIGTEFGFTDEEKKIRN